MRASWGALETFVRRHWVNLLSLWLLLWLAANAWVALYARRAEAQAAEANRIAVERTATFRVWAATFKRIEERQVLYLSTVKSEIPPEQWARIEELNRDAGLK